MNKYDGELYERFSSSVRHQVKSLHVILDALQVANCWTVADAFIVLNVKLLYHLPLILIQY